MDEQSDSEEPERTRVTCVTQWIFIFVLVGGILLGAVQVALNWW